MTRHQFGMRPLFDQLPIFQDQNLLRHADRREADRDSIFPCCYVIARVGLPHQFQHLAEM
jgi:hypothetical protein